MSTRVLCSIGSRGSGDRFAIPVGVFIELPVWDELAAWADCHLDASAFPRLYALLTSVLPWTTTPGEMRPLRDEAERVAVAPPDGPVATAFEQVREYLARAVEHIEANATKTRPYRLSVWVYVVGGPRGGVFRRGGA